MASTHAPVPVTALEAVERLPLRLVVVTEAGMASAGSRTATPPAPQRVVPFAPNPASAITEIRQHAWRARVNATARAAAAAAEAAAACFTASALEAASARTLLLWRLGTFLRRPMWRCCSGKKASASSAEKLLFWLETVVFGEDG